jgi:hypothetical protein
LLRFRNAEPTEGVNVAVLSNGVVLAVTRVLLRLTGSS